MDPLSDLVLHGTCPSSFEHALSRAEVNRLRLVALIQAVHACGASRLRSVLLSELRLYHGFRSAVAHLLAELNRLGVEYVVIKHAPYPHVSYDIDIVFADAREYLKAKKLLICAGVRVDPHVGGLRDYKALTIVVPAEYILEHSVEGTVEGVEARVAEPGLSALIYALHAFKHREVYLGDLMAYMYYSHVGYEGLKRHAERLGAHLVLSFIDALASVEAGAAGAVESPLSPELALLACAVRRASTYPLRIPKPLIALAAAKPKLLLEARRPGWARVVELVERLHELASEELAEEREHLG